MKLANSPVVLAAIILAGLLLGYVYRWIFPIYVPIFFSFFLSGLLFAHSIKRAQWVVHNLAFAFLALAITELYFEFNKTDEHAAHPHIMQSQDGLGYVARRGIFRAVKTYGFGTGVVYDVHYSMPNGLRIAPESLKQTGPTVMFFGDSFTFGVGVNDEDTLPNSFSIVSRMRVLNFALDGYGPHHMLRLLELDVPKKITASFPRLMVYTAIENHIRRAAGRAEWDKNGPLYEIQNGHAHYTGSFGEHDLACDPDTIRRSVIEKLLRHSRIWQAYVGRDRCLAPNDQDTLIRDRMKFLEIVKAANIIALQKYQSCLVVILWDVRAAYSASGYSASAEQNEDWIEAKLLENNIPTLRLSREISDPNFQSWIIKRDRHPSPRAYREVAEVLLSWLMKNPTIVPLQSQ
jgi:hypothetical protein